MAKNIIQVEHLSKLYKLGEINTGSLSHDLKRWWFKIKGREDPYEKLGEINDRTERSNSGYVWSLKDINFTVKEGEVFGIIGKNGAGKSTLLKLLSKITKPTRGSIKLDGRVASLLEVGTGFHPDLSGRENVFLNGAILGLRKHEIKTRFDEIVNFSGIERYIDTPVKRYSSGMFVRLAFAVAAHLEPDILIIDEVLAVGDAEFQQKCIGKMQDVSNKQGRTVLFVSHNVTAIKQLCSRALLLEFGQTKFIGSVDKALEVYQGSGADKENGMRNKIPENAPGYFLSWRLNGQTPTDAHSCYTRESVELVFLFRSETELNNCEFNFRILNDDASTLFYTTSMDFGGKQFSLKRGIYQFTVQLALPIIRGKYAMEVGLYSLKWVDIWKTTTRLNVLDTFEGHSRDSIGGILNLQTKFSYAEVETFHQERINENV